MTHPFRISSWAACLVLGAATAFVMAQDADEVAPDNHDRQFVANLGAARMFAHAIGSVIRREPASSAPDVSGA